MSMQQRQARLPSTVERFAIIRTALPRLRPNCNPLAEIRGIRPARTRRSTGSASRDRFAQQPAAHRLLQQRTTLQISAVERFAIIRAALSRLRPKCNPLAEIRDIRPAQTRRSIGSASTDRFAQQPASSMLMLQRQARLQSNVGHFAWKWRPGDARGRRTYNSGVRSCAQVWRER